MIGSRIVRDFTTSAVALIMALLCAGIVKLLFVVRDRLLRWQKGFI